MIALMIATALAAAPPSIDEPTEDTLEQVAIMRVLLTREWTRALGTSSGIAARGRGGASGPTVGATVATSSDGAVVVTGVDPAAAPFAAPGAAPAGPYGWDRPLLGGARRTDDNPFQSVVTARSVTSHTRGFLLEGVGAWFSSEIQVPLVPEASSKPPISASEQRDDDWAAARRQLQGDGADGGTFGLMQALDATAAVGVALSDDAIDQAREVAFRVLADHGHRLEGVAPDESIVVAMRFVPDGRISYGVANTAGAFSLRAAAAPRERTMILRMSKRDAMEYHAGALDELGLRGRTSVTSYVGG